MDAPPAESVQAEQTVETFENNQSDSKGFLENSEIRKEEEIPPPPSSVDHEKEILEKPEIEENQATPTPSPEIPKQGTKCEHNEVKEKSEETKASSKRRAEVNNPLGVVIPRAKSLVYWEDPMYSGGVLGVSLSIIIFTSQFSLFSTFCALAVLLLSANWIYVLGVKQFQVLFNKENVSPYEHYFEDKPWYIERSTVDKYLDGAVDCVNFTLQESQKIILVDDPMRTLKYVFLSYAAWTVGGWFCFHTLTTIALILGFTVPLAYQRNKVIVDQQLEKAHAIFNSYWERATGILKKHTKGAVEKGRSFAVSKGLMVSKEE